MKSDEMDVAGYIPLIVSALRSFSGSAQTSAVREWIESYLNEHGKAMDSILPSGEPKLNNDIRWARYCLDRFGDGHASEKAKQEFLKWTDTECNRMNALFLGYDPETEHKSPWPYQRGIWNTADQLGTYLRIHFVPSEDETRYAVRDAFMSFVVDITTATTQNDGMPLEEWGWMLEGATEGLRDALLGINQDALDGVL